MLYRTDSQTLFNGLADGFTFGSAGIFGGYPGNSGYRHSLHGTDMAEIIEAKKPYPTRDGDPEDSDVERLVSAQDSVFDNHATAGPQEFGEGDLYVSVHRGGPGLGDPLERDPAAVEADLNSGDLLPRFADSIYGVVAAEVTGAVGAPRWEVDAAATDARRAEIRQERLARSVPASEFLAAERERVLAGSFIDPVLDMYRSSMELSPTWREKFVSFWNLPADFAI
jgi:N-methylhydantoinase B/acetone carboxylase alpha subunit